MMRNNVLIYFLIIACCLTGKWAYAGDITLRMPTYFNGQHEYFFELIQLALEADGHSVNIETKPPLPHLRERKMFEQGQFNVLWLIKSSERDLKYVPVNVPLTNGLIGQRIILTGPKQIEDFVTIKTLKDLQDSCLIAGLGTGWYDKKVWDNNNLSYISKANWQLFYRMLENGTRGVDYFPRGFNEILDEFEDHQSLIIEPNLILQYDRDFIFYVTPSEAGLAPVMLQALRKAKKNGLMERLIKKHWAQNFKILKPETRTVIHLDTP